MVELKLDQIGVQVASVDGGSRWILEDISCTCRSGERLGIIGRNGSGKTTLARLIGGLDGPTRGTLQVQPKDVRIMLALQRPEDHFIRETVGQQIASYASQRLEKAAVQSLLARVGLSPNLENYAPRRLSSGHQRLVAIACTLAAKPSFIVLDEPMAGLDSYGRHLVAQALTQLNRDQRLGLILISHHPDDLLGLVERLWILEEGRLLYDGPFERAPVAVLSKCLSPDDNSLYYALRKLEDRGISLPGSVYHTARPDEISELLLRDHIC